MANMCQVESTPFNFIESQENEPEAILSMKDSDGAERRSDTDVQRNVTPRKLTEAVPKILSRGTRSTPMSAERKAEAKSTPTRRLRHDDSQIQFAAIDSSPLGSDALDSQLLTDRQKEVTERQRLEAAAMFPSLGSRPPARGRDSEGALPRLFLSADRRSHENVDADETASPTLPPVDALMNDFIPSSPSSRSSQKRSDAKVNDIEPPSSPLAVRVQADALSLDGPPSSPPRMHQGHDGLTAVDELASRVVAELQYHNRENPAVDLAMQNPTPVLPPKANLDTPSCDLQVAASPQVKHYYAAGEHFASDLDIFVDARSSPVASSPPTSAEFREGSLEYSQMLKLPEEQDETTNTAAHHGAASKEPDTRTMNDALLQDEDPTASAYQEDVSRIDDSFQAPSPRSSPGHEEQTSAQLVDDLERASSQVELQGATATEMEVESPQVKRKRKRASESPASSPKKKKVRSPRKSVQVVIERRKTASAVEELHDCIVVDTSAVKGHRHPLSQEIKPEQSPSSAFATESLTSTPRPQAKPARRGRPPRKGSVTSQEVQPRISRKRKALRSSSPAAEPEGDMDDQPAQPASKRRRSTRLSQTSAASQEGYTPIASQKLGRHGYASVNKSTKPLVLAGNEEDGNFSAEEADTELLDPTPQAVSERSVSMSESPVEDPSKADGRDETTAADTGADAHSNSSPIVKNSNQHQEDELGEGPHSVAGDESEMQATPSAAAYDMSHKSVEAAVEAAEAKGKARMPSIHKGQGILMGLKQMLRDIQHVTLGQGEEREIGKALFELGNEVYEAGRRRS